jgi:type VI protein secretion system component Hcp
MGGTIGIGGGGGGGGSTGKVAITDINIARRFDSASARFFELMVTGIHIKVVFTIYSGATTKDMRLRYTVEDCVLSSYTVPGSGGSENVVEWLTFNFKKIDIEIFGPTEK